jgi:hypothetical protein
MFEHEDSRNDSAPSNPRAGDTPGFGSGGGGGNNGNYSGGGGNSGDGNGGGGGGYENQGRGSNVTDARPQSPAEAGAQADMNRAMMQGQGANVTNTQPQPPAFTAIENLSRNINPISFPGGSSATSMWSPTMSGFAIQPTTNTIGVPTLVLDTMRPTTPVPSFQNTPYGIDVNRLSPTTFQQDKINNFLNKTGYIESKNNPLAVNKDTKAIGEFQLTKTTAFDLMNKYYPDLIVGQTKDQVFRNVALNEALQKDLTTKLAQDNMASLSRSGIAPTDTNAYLAHWFGDVKAKSVITSDANTPIESIIGEDAASKNKLTGLTAGEVKAKADQAMAAAGRATSTNNGIGSAGGFGRVADLLNPTFQSDTTPSVVSKIGDTTPVSTTSLDRRVAPDAVAAATKAPESFGDWLGSFFNTSDQVSKVLAEPNRVATIPGLPNTTSGMTKQEWADSFGVDPSEVKARVSTINGAPQVDYYSKELSDIPGEILKGIGEGIGSLFGNRDVNKMPQGSSVRDPRFLDMFSGSGREAPITESRGNDKISVNANSNMATQAPVTVASATPETPVALGTGIDYTPRKYNPGNIVVRTPSYRLS